jgi:hypothetical protein
LRSGSGVLRARPAFRLPQVTSSARSREQELVALLRTSRPATELPVRVATYTYAEPGSPQMRVVVSAETDAGGGIASQVLLGYVLMDTRGVIAASGAHRSGDGRHAFSTVVGPGTYSLRVAGIDPLGRRGLTERPFSAAVEHHAGLRLSDLILAPTPRETGAPLQPFVDRIAEANVTAYMELATDASQSAADLRVSFEIAPEAPGSAERSVQAIVDTRDARLAVARAVVSLEGLPAGRYLAHARIVVPGQPDARVTRPFTYRPAPE